jgi:hypothetical protein
MAKQNKAIVTDAAIQKADLAIRLIRSGGLLVLGVVGLVATVSGTLFANAGDATSSGWLYQNLGKEGATLVAFILFLLFTVVGGFWTARVVKGMRAR